MTNCMHKQETKYTDKWSEEFLSAIIPNLPPAGANVCGECLAIYVLTRALLLLAVTYKLDEAAMYRVGTEALKHLTTEKDGSLSIIRF